MPLPDIIRTTDSFNTWFNATNNLTSHVSNANAFVLPAQNGTPQVANGNVSINGTATLVTIVANNFTLTNPTTNAVFTGNVEIGNRLTVASDTTLGNSVTITRNLALSGNVTGALNITATANVTANIAIANTLFVNANANVIGTLGVTGAANTLATLGVGGVFTALGNTVLTGNATLSNTLAVTGNVTFSNTLAVTGNATFNNAVSVTGNVTAAAFSGNGIAITTVNAATLTGTINTATLPIATASANGLVRFNSTQTFGGDKNFANAVVIQETLQVANAVTFTNTLAVTGNITTTSNVSAVNFSGAGAAITSINATNITLGTLDAARLASGSIGYSKLTLTGSIVNGDISAGAGIAYGKLALSNSIVNGDVSASAAIAYSKLSLTGSIVNADISGSAAIAVSKLAASTISGVTLGSNLNAVTFSNGGGGVASGTTYNGSGAITVSYNTVGAPSTTGAGASGSSWNISILGSAASASTATTATTATQVSNGLNFNNGGSGDASGTTYNGSAGRTISYNSIGAAALSGVNATGTWPINISGSAASATTATNISAFSINQNLSTSSVVTFGAVTQTVGYFSRRNSVDEGGAIVMRAAPGNVDAVLIDVHESYGYSAVLRIFPAGPAVVRSGGSGGVWLLPGDISWSAFSDERLKVLESPIVGAVDRLTTLRTMMGRFKKDAPEIQRPFLVAQDIEKVFPELIKTAVATDDDSITDARMLSYQDLIPYLVAAIKELSGQVTDLTAQVTALSARS